MAFFFISHAHEDERSAEDLHTRLQSWGFTSLFLDVDPHDGLRVGSQWREELFSQIRSTDALIFIGTPSSLESKWCWWSCRLVGSHGQPADRNSPSSSGRLL
ncbi:toll/interleukin-1 receptor domain-containing protein [Streptomyces poonensis]|uniref:toll/interleukin-1 receptor domain-containing protein n=1 Tax=Streptomyces poonensis TaxID=68255 RepID=UPI00167965DA